MRARCQRGLGEFELVLARHRVHVMRLHGRQLEFLDILRHVPRRHAHMHELGRHGFAQVREHVLEEREALGLELVHRVALSVGAEVDHRAQMFEHDEVLAPEGIERL